MSVPEEIRRKVEKWFAFADDDLRLAEHGLSLPGGVPCRLVAYHAQQCAEKYLKGYLVLRGIDFPYTHNISRLIEICGETAASWTETLRDAEELSVFAITTRYPGEDEEVTEAEARRAIGIAESVRKAVLAAIKREERKDF